MARTKVNDDSILTLGKLLRDYALALRPPLYYAIVEYAPKTDDDGKCIYFLLPESDFAPETFVCHPDNFPLAEKTLSEFRTLIDLKEWRPRLSPAFSDMVMERISQSFDYELRVHRMGGSRG
jgi:hypothetical protein